MHSQRASCPGRNTLPDKIPVNTLDTHPPNLITLSVRHVATKLRTHRRPTRPFRTPRSSSHFHAADFTWRIAQACLDGRAIGPGRFHAGGLVPLWHAPAHGPGRNGLRCSVRIAPHQLDRILCHSALPHHNRNREI